MVKLVSRSTLVLSGREKVKKVRWASFLVVFKESWSGFWVE